MITHGFWLALQRLQTGDLDARITQVGFGTSGAAESEDDTALTGALVKPIAAVETDPERPRTLRFRWLLAPNEANGLMIREIGLLTADDILVARKVRASAIEKTPDMELGDWFEIQL